MFKQKIALGLALLVPIALLLTGSSYGTDHEGKDFLRIRLPHNLGFVVGFEI